MDLTFLTEEGVFNLRVCAVIVHGNTVLAMHDGRSPYYYLPGGRVRLQERMEDALLREIREELGAEARLVRPLWLNQGFFTEDVTGQKYHELCLYCLVELSEDADLPMQGVFTREEGTRTLTFAWLAFERLEREYFYPIFLKTKIFALPEQLELLAEYE